MINRKGVKEKKEKKKKECTDSIICSFKVDFGLQKQSPEGALQLRHAFLFFFSAFVPDNFNYDHFISLLVYVLNKHNVCESN